MPKQRAVEKKNMTIMLIIVGIVCLSFLVISGILIGVFVGIAAKVKSNMDSDYASYRNYIDKKYASSNSRY